jgi:hypothetical protein
MPKRAKILHKHQLQDLTFSLKILGILSCLLGNLELKMHYIHCHHSKVHFDKDFLSIKVEV